MRQVMIYIGAAAALGLVALVPETAAAGRRHHHHHSWGSRGGVAPSVTIYTGPRYKYDSRRSHGYYPSYRRNYWYGYGSLWRPWPY